MKAVEASRSAHVLVNTLCDQFKSTFQDYVFLPKLKKFFNLL